VAAGDDALGADLYGRLPDQGNLVFSPASIATALRLMLLGARGGTAAQIAAALHLARPGDAGPGLRAASDLLHGLAAGDLTLRAPNTMWVQSGLALEPGFTAALAGAAAVALRDADFRRAADQARQEINQFIAEQTGGKITDLLGPGVIDATATLVLASAVYLKAAWAHPFPAGATGDAPFHPGPGTQVTVPTMRVRATLRYAHGHGYQAVELPYAGARLGMVIVLPDGAPGPVPGEPARDLRACWPGWHRGRSAWRCRASGWRAVSRCAPCWPGWACRRRSAPTRTSAASPPRSGCASARWCTRPTSTWTSRAPRRPRPPPW
jgi:serpin B